MLTTSFRAAGAFRKFKGLGIRSTGMPDGDPSDFALGTGIAGLVLLFIELVSDCGIPEVYSSCVEGIALVISCGLGPARETGCTRSCGRGGEYSSVGYGSLVDGGGDRLIGS